MIFSLYKPFEQKSKVNSKYKNDCIISIMTFKLHTSHIKQKLVPNNSTMIMKKRKILTLRISKSSLETGE